MVKKLKKYLRIYPYFLSRNMQAKTAYRADFLLGVVANFLQQTTGLLFITTIYGSLESVGGWSLYQVLFLYGFMSIPSGLAELFLDGVWGIPGEYVSMGNLDKLLTRPLNPLFSIIAGAMELHGLGLVIFGVLVCGISMGAMGVAFSAAQVLIALVALISGAFIYFATNLMMATLSFWVINIGSSMVLIHDLNKFTRYPITIYHKAIQIILTFVIPYAVISYYPSSYLLGLSQNWIFACAAPLTAIVFCFIAVKFFNFGLKSYKSAGG